MVDPLAWEGKGNLIMIFQNVHAMTDCLDVCKFSTFAESLDGFAAQFAAITGKPCTADELFKAGERVYNLERYYNNLNGFREGSDTLPKRFLTEPSQRRLQGPGLRAGQDAGGVLPAARLGGRRRAGSQAEGAGDHLARERVAKATRLQ